METFLDNMVTMTAILFPILLVAVILLFSHRKDQERNRLIQQLIEKGEDPKTIATLLDKGKAEDKTPEKHFRSGVTLLAIGLGLVLTWLVADWGSMHAIGGFLAIIGLGEIVIAWYLRKYSK